MRNVYGLLVWFVSTLFVIYAFCLNTAGSVFSGVIKTSLHLSDIQVSYATGAFIAGFALMQIPAGYLLDRYNTKIVVSLGVLLLALGNILTSYADGLVFFTLSNFMQGVGGSFAFIATAVLISNWFSPRVFPVLFGLTQTLSCVLAGIIHYVFLLALTTLSWNELYKYLAIIGFVLFVLNFLIVRSPKRECAATKPLSLGKALHIVCSNPQIWLCSIAAATTFGVLLAYAGLWYMKIQTFYSVSQESSSILSAIIFVGIGIGTPLFGYVSNIFKSRVMIAHITIVLGLMMLLLGIYLPHYNSDSLILINIISFFIGFFLSGSMIFYTIVSEISTDNTRGVALSIVNTSVFLFNTMLVVLPYMFITTVSKDFYTYLWVLPFCGLISLICLYFVKDSYR